MAKERTRKESAEETEKLREVGEQTSTFHTRREGKEHGN
jgi:hypothetical protein